VKPRTSTDSVRASLLTSMFTLGMACEEFLVGIDDVGKASDDGKSDARIRYERRWLDTAGDHERNYAPVEWPPSGGDPRRSLAVGLRPSKSGATPPRTT
jgi:hypothetical protein